jgi:hypothetical protein
MLAGSIALLALLYLAIPVGLAQPPGWSPRLEHASEVAQLYRTRLGLGGLSVEADQLRVLNPLLLLLAGAGYGLVLWSRPRGLRFRTLATLCVPLGLSSVLMPPLYATDIFYYAVSGEIVARFGANPYLFTPADFPASALLPFNYWTSITSPYGPLWTSLSSATAFLSSADPFLCTLGLKLLALGAIAATGACIWIFLQATQPGAERFGVMLFTLNPFVWLSAVGDGHVDVVMAALMAAAACLLARWPGGLASWCCIGAATLVKYLTAPLLPVFFLTRLRIAGGRAGRVRVVVVLLAAFIGLAIIAWAPYWAGAATLTSLLEEGSRGYSAPPLLMLQASAAALGLPDGAIDLLADVAAALMLAGLLTWILRALRNTSPVGVIAEVRSWALTISAVAALIPRSHPWYFLTGMALLAAVHPTTRRTTFLVYAVSGAWFFWRVSRI